MKDLNEWKRKVLEEEVSNHHRKAVFKAVSEELASYEITNNRLKWALKLIYAISFVAVITALIQTQLPKSIDTQVAQQEVEINDAQLLLELDNIDQFIGAAEFADDLEVLEDLELLEQLDDLENWSES